MSERIATLFYESIFTGFDLLGVRAAGGKVYTLVSGTGTPQATYQDHAATILNSNPVILDGNGEAKIFLIPGVEYTISLVDSTDVTLWSYDGVRTPVGEDGDPGGPKGPDGDQGPQGIQGIQGIVGIGGLAGNKGIKGQSFVTEVEFTAAGSSTSWTVPDGITQIFITGIGGGGCGSIPVVQVPVSGAAAPYFSSDPGLGLFYSSGGSGGPGQFAYRVPFSVTPGDILMVKVGAGGSASGFPNGTPSSVVGSGINLVGAGGQAGSPAQPTKSPSFPFALGPVYQGKPGDGGHWGKALPLGYYSGILGENEPTLNPIHYRHWPQSSFGSISRAAAVATCIDGADSPWGIGKKNTSFMTSINSNYTEPSNTGYGSGGSAGLNIGGGSASYNLPGSGTGGYVRIEYGQIEVHGTSTIYASIAGPPPVIAL